MKAAFIEVTRFLLILLFVYTASSKIQTFHSFQILLVKSPLIGKTLALYVAIFIPAIEIIATLLLVFPKTALKGFYLSTALMAMFTLYVSYMVLFAPKLPCLCGGVIEAMSWKQHILFNAVFTIMSFTCCILYKCLPTKKQTGILAAQPV